MPTVAMPDGSTIDIGDIKKLSDSDIDKLLSAISPESLLPGLNNLPPVVNPYAPENLSIPTTEEMVANEPPPIDLSGIPEQIPGLLVDMAKRGALPTAGAVGGTVLGGLAGPFASIAIPALEGLGSMGGEYLNQKLGITEPDNLQLGLAGAIPQAFRGLGTLGKLALPVLGPGKAIKTLNVLGAQEADDFMRSFKAEIPSKTLFEKAAASGAVIDMTDSYNEAGRLLKQLKTPSKGLRNTDVINILEEFRENISPTVIQKKPLFPSFPSPTPKPVKPKIKNPMELQAELEGIGRKVGQLSRGGTDVGAIKKIFETVIQDIEKEATKSGKALGGNRNIGIGAGAQDLLDARQAFKRETSIGTVLDYIEKSGTILKGQGGDMQFSAKSVIDKIKKDKFFTSSFSGEEQQEIYGLLKKLNRIPALRPGAGATTGSSRFTRMMVSGGLGGLLTGSPLGYVAGAVIPPVAENLQVIGKILSLRSGRKMLGDMLKKGPLTSPDIGVLAAFLASQNSDLNFSSAQLPSLTEIPPEFQGID